MSPTAVQLSNSEPSPTVAKAVHSACVVEPRQGDPRAVLVIHDGANDSIVRTVADVLGRRWRMINGAHLTGIDVDETDVLGILATEARPATLSKIDRTRTISINTHCIARDDSAPDSALTDACDYEFLYSDSLYFRRDLSRFLSHVLGQTDFHEQLVQKERSYFISTTFPDVRTALSNLDILTVGADAVELRVDLLKESQVDGVDGSIPSLKYVGEQVMLLRQRTELPLIFTTRCTRENGKFPMDDPNVFYKYLNRAIQWGVEYIDVELWLPEDIRRKLAEIKGSSRIISAYHDFSGELKWTSDRARELFKEGSKYGDIVKMIKIIGSMSENYSLQVFRSSIESQPGQLPLSAVNMGQLGQLSRALNTVFSPITHPLLPIIAAPGQMSAAEINNALYVMGQTSKRDIYAIGTFRSSPQSVFFEKCFNELGLPHHLATVSRGPKGTAEAFVMQPNFGGAYVHPPLTSTQSYIPCLTDAAQQIRHIDTIVVREEGEERTLEGDNATWKGIRATLTRDFVPSAYSGRTALVLSNTEADAAPAIFALKSLGIGKVYTVGFKVQGPLASNVEPFTSVDSMKKVTQPFVIVSALAAEKSMLVQPLLRHYSNNHCRSPNGGGKVYVDLTDGPRKGDPLAVAAASGWTAYGTADVGAWTTVETLRLLVGQNVPFDFVRMASGRGIY
jgi:3-dehydroquinate dehydratase-1